MKSLSQFGVVILLLVSYLTPAMACMVSDMQMNAEERACCQEMQSRCQQMRMPASHGCCQKTPQSVLDRALVTRATNDHSTAIAIVWLIVYESLQPSLVNVEWTNRPDNSPPQFPAAPSSVLRI